MKHRTARRKLSAFLDGELMREEARAVESHLGACDSCREILEQMRVSWERLTMLPEAEPSPHALAGIMAGMASESGDAGFSRLERFLVPATAAAALALGVWLGSVVGRNGEMPASYGARAEESAVYMEPFDELPNGSLARVYIDLAAAE